MAESKETQPAEDRRLDPPRIFAAGSFALGALVLVGWVLGIDSLTRIFPGLVAMKANAALGFLFGGAALWLIRQGRPVSRWAVGLALVVSVIGGLTTLEYAAGLDLGIDEILVREPTNAIGQLFPGRMHPTTAFNFLWLGLALALIAADREHRTAHGLALLAALIAVSTLIGYIFGVRVFVGLAAFHQMALHTTLGMLALSIGLLLVRPRQGLMTVISSDGPGGLMARRLIPVAILAPILLNGLTVLARQTGYLDDDYGAAVRSTAMIAILVGFIGRNAFTLYRIDLDRKKAELEQLDTEGRFRFLADSMPQIVWTSRPDSQIQYINRRWFEFTGQDPDQEWNWQAVLHPDDLAHCLGQWERALRSGESYQGEYRFRSADGAYRWHLVRSEPRRDESGRIVQWIGTSTDIHDQKWTGEQRYRSLVEATTSIVWNTPASGNFESEQPGWSDFTGQSYDELKGWGWLDAIHPDDRTETARVWSVAVARTALYQVEHRIRRRDGVYRHMLVRAVPLIDPNGKLAEWVGVHTDIDDLKRTEEAMRKAKEAAEAATRAKGEFLANMSHEIRTPMNGIIGMTELTLNTELTPRQREYLGLLRSSADGLLTVINDILDFSKIEAGKLELDPVSFAIRDLVTDTLRTLALKAHDKGLELACRIGPDVPETVIGDTGRLRQVLVNLVGNAVKFTERGEVVVTVEVAPGVEDSGKLRFSVADTGIGIPLDRQAAIFEAFEQADGSTTRKYGGTGLGLTISVRLVELMNGRIWVEENSGGGTIFRFTADLAADPLGRVERLEPDPTLLEGVRVLVVDDNRTNRLILEEIFWQWGCRPTVVESAREALVSLERAAGREEPFALVVLDRMMPEIDGLELTRRIRAESRYLEIKLLMLTSGGSDDSGEFRELGVGAWLAKPVSQSGLLDAVLDLMGTKGARFEPILVRPPAPASNLTRRRLRVLLVEDHSINQIVASMMLEEQGHEVTIVGNGRLAVEAVAAKSFDLALMDLQMPEMDGFEALATIRRRELIQGGHLPIVALTAHAMAGDRERCLDSGFDDYLSKPIHDASLAATLDRLCGGRPALPEPAPPALAAPVHPAFDLPAALKALGGKERVLAEILGIFVREGPRLLGEIRLAIEAGDPATLMRLGHTLAGAAVHFKAPDFVASARKLEALGKTADLAGADEALRGCVHEFDRFLQAVGDSGFELGAKA